VFGCVYLPQPLPTFSEEEKRMKSKINKHY
jgi:hypothetical protein